MTANAHKSEMEQHECFEYEVRLLMTLQCKSIVKFYGYAADEAGKPKYIVMELAPDGSLTHYLESMKGALLLPQAFLQFCADILDGLTYLHNLHPNFIVHRDIKPANVLVFPSPGRTPLPLRLKLCDFGISALSSAVLSGDEAPRGEPSSHYCPSEAVDYCESLHPALDMFSFGVMMCDVICKHMVQVEVPSSKTLTARKDIISTAIGYLGKLEYLSQLAAMLERCCSNDHPEVRPTAAEVLAEVSRLQHTPT